MRVDVHNHAIPEQLLDLYRAEPAFGVTVEDGRWRGSVHVDFALPKAFYDPQAKLMELEQAGLEGAVLSVSPTDYHYHLDPEAGAAAARAANAGLADMANAVPDRLFWMASLPMQDPQAAAAMLADAVETGARGVAIGTSAAAKRLDDPVFAPFWAAADAAGLPVLLHPAYNEPNPSLQAYYLSNVIGNQLETTVAIERLICEGVLDRCPNLHFILVHGGGYFPWQAGRLRHAAGVRPELAGSPPDPWRYLDRLWFDQITHDQVMIELLVRRVGLERVVMGTDLPFDMAPSGPVKQLEAAVGAAGVAAITEHNPARLFGLPS
jgi:aminocarboxymuconate-semialdehyde decarboxylase